MIQIACFHFFFCILIVINHRVQHQPNFKLYIYSVQNINRSDLSTTDSYVLKKYIF